MAIRKIEENSNESLSTKFVIDNGDLQALKSVMEQYGFVNEEALLRYALVSLLESTDNTLYIKKDENIVAVKIAPTLLKRDDDSGTTTEA
jgi:hypothetical protein